MSRANDVLAHIGRVGRIIPTGLIILRVLDKLEAGPVGKDAGQGRQDPVQPARR